MQFATSAISVLSLILLALPGFVLIKTKLLKPSAIPPLVTVLLYVNQPFITLNAFLSKEYESSLLLNMGIVILVAVLSQLFILYFARTVFSSARNGRLPIKTINLPLGAKKDRLRANAYTYAGALGNVGFMGIPIVSVILPNNPEAILYVSLFMMTFNIICWTLGIYILTGDRKYISIKKAIFNPPIIAMIIALPIFFLKVKLPPAIMQPITFLADMNTPLAMIILGMRFATVKFRELFVGFGMYVTSFIKLVINPLFVYAVLMPFQISFTARAVLVIISAMPSANMVLMMSEKFNGDTVASVKAVMNTTLLSMLTIPLILLLPL